eukprot:2359520-Rhodomonas_salina.2
MNATSGCCLYSRTVAAHCARTVSPNASCAGDPGAPALDTSTPTSRKATSAICACNELRIALCSSTVLPLRLTLRRIDHSITLRIRLTLRPPSTTSTSTSSNLGAPITSRLHSGGSSISASDGKKLTHCRSAHRSIWPTVISYSCGIPLLKSTYPSACSLRLDVDRNPNSTPPRLPLASSPRKHTGTLSPAKPLYTFLFGGNWLTVRNLSNALTSTRMDVT